MKPLHLLPIFIIALVAAFLSYALMRPANTLLPSQWIDKPLQPMALPAIATGVAGIQPADFTNGKPKLVNLFGSYCIPCVHEAPQLAALKAQGVEIYGVALRDETSYVNTYLQRNGNPYVKIGTDPESRFAIMLGSTGIPETYVVDGKGVVRAQHIGEVRPEDVAGILAQLKALR
jgi:cytochrome c biogenesis protein CcmG, thiol:disulfide interchange protein DsbE